MSPSVHPPVYTVDDVRAHLRRYATNDGLCVLNRLSRWIMHERPTAGISGVAIEPGFTASQWDLAFLAKQLVLCSNDFRARRLSVESDQRGLRQALSLVSNMRDPVLGGHVTSTSEQVLHFLIRIAYQQFRHQGRAETALFRTYLLYDQVWRTQPVGLDLDLAARDVYGVPICSVLALGFVLFSLASTDKFAAFQISAITNMPDTRFAALQFMLLPEKVSRLWPLVATDYDDFRTRCRENQVAPEYARFEWNPLESRPVIITKRSPTTCVIPSLTSLLFRFTDGIYYDFVSHFDTPGGQRPFSQAFGKVFEEYVGQQLRAHYSNGVVVAERQYPVGTQEWRGPDWIVVEGRNALLIECRASRLVLDGKVMASETLIANEVENKLLKTISRFADKIRHIQSAPDLWPELDGVTNFYPIVVTNDPWWPAQAFHEVLNRSLIEQSIPPYHIISIDCLEGLLPFASAGVRVSDILQERIERGQQGWEFGQELDEWATRYGVVRKNLVIEAAKERFFKTLGIGAIIDSTTS